MRLHPILIVCLLAPEAFAQKPCPGSDCDVAEANRPVEWLLRIHKTLLEGLRRSCLRPAPASSRGLWFRILPVKCSQFD
jgi:hypothetical protein